MSSIFPPVGDYALRIILGKGSFGTVYLAKDTSGKNFAIKTMNNEENAKKEIDSLKSLPIHDNIVKFVDAFFESGRYYIVLEYIEGCSLLSHLQTLGICHDEMVILPLLQQMLNALRQIHAAGIVHMDLKPDNFMVEKATGRVVLIDFGLSARTGSERNSPFTGTALFLPPEVARTPEGSVHLSYLAPVQNQTSVDIWSSGIVIQLMLTHKFPYTCLKSQFTIVYEIANLLKAPIVDDLQKNTSHFGLFMLDIVTRCLQIYPQLRPTAQELWKLITEYKSP